MALGARQLSYMPQATSIAADRPLPVLAAVPVLDNRRHKRAAACRLPGPPPLLPCSQCLAAPPWPGAAASSYPPS